MFWITFLTMSCYIVSGYQPLKYLDLTKYDGFWYEVYKDKLDDTFQLNGSCVTANYSIIDNKVGIVNSEIYPNGSIGIITGYAFYEDDNTGGELSVVLDGVNEIAPYWVVKLGPVIDNYYDYSVVSDDKKLSLFVLARDITRFFNNYDEEVLTFLQDEGFTMKFNKPLITNQTYCDYTYRD